MMNDQKTYNDEDHVRELLQTLPDSFGNENAYFVKSFRIICPEIETTFPTLKIATINNRGNTGLVNKYIH